MAMITIEAEGPVLLIRGRGKDKKRYEKRVDKYKPYFYVKAEPGDSVHAYDYSDKTPLTQVFVDHPGEVPKERENYEKTWEADLTYVNRYLIDAYEGVIPQEPIRVCHLDIETDIQQTGVDPEKPDSAITCLCCEDTFLNKQFQFAWHPTKQNESTDEYELYVYKNEKEMLEMFTRFVVKTDPDIITAWWGETFDFPYVVNRMKWIGLDSNRLSPWGQSGTKNAYRKGGKNFRETYVRGRVLLDLKEAYKHKYTSGKESYSLDYIGKLEVGMEKEKYEGSLDDLKKNDFDKYLSYNRTDVKIMRAIDEKTGLIEFFDNKRRKAKCTFPDIYSNMRVIDFLTADYCKRRGWALPTNPREEIEDHAPEGGLVVKPKKGVHKNVAVADFRSLYPSIMISMNMSYETFGGEGYYIKDVTLVKPDKTVYSFDVSFGKERKGLISTILKDLLDERVMWKEKMKKLKKEGKTDSPEFKNIDGTQYALKELLNSFYGVLGNKYYRLYKKEIAGAITTVARKTNLWMQKELKKYGYDVAYGDTDSVFFSLKSKNQEGQIKEGNEIVDKINESFKEFASSMGIEDHILEAEFEKIYTAIFFEEGKKKLYAGWKTWEQGPVDEVEIKGFAAKRSNNPEISRNFQEKIFELILKGKEKNEVYDYVRQFEKEIRDRKYSDFEMGIPAGLTKNPWLYGSTPGTGTSPNAKAVQNSNKFWDMKIQVGERFKYLPVKRAPMNVPSHHVIAFRDILPKGYEIDIDEIVRTHVHLKVERVFEALGWNLAEAEGQMGLGEWS